MTKRKTVWLVEMFGPDGKSEGWWTAPPKESGGWRTENAWAAKEYTQREAESVAAALDYFSAPFRWAHWRATEHVFIKNYDGWQHCGPASTEAACGKGTT